MYSNITTTVLQISTTKNLSLIYLLVSLWNYFAFRLMDDFGMLTSATDPSQYTQLMDSMPSKREMADAYAQRNKVPVLLYLTSQK